MLGMLYAMHHRTAKLSFKGKIVHGALQDMVKVCHKYRCAERFEDLFTLSIYGGPGTPSQPAGCVDRMVIGAMTGNRVMFESYAEEMLRCYGTKAPNFGTQYLVGNVPATILSNIPKRQQQLRRAHADIAYSFPAKLAELASPLKWCDTLHSRVGNFFSVLGRFSLLAEEVEDNHSVGNMCQTLSMLQGKAKTTKNFFEVLDTCRASDCKICVGDSTRAALQGTMEKALAEKVDHCTLCYECYQVDQFGVVGLCKHTT